MSAYKYLICESTEGGMEEEILTHEQARKLFLDSTYFPDDGERERAIRWFRRAGVGKVFMFGRGLVVIISGVPYSTRGMKKP